MKYLFIELAKRTRQVYSWSISTSVGYILEAHWTRFSKKKFQLIRRLVPWKSFFELCAVHNGYSIHSAFVLSLGNRHNRRHRPLTQRFDISQVLPVETPVSSRSSQGLVEPFIFAFSSLEKNTALTTIRYLISKELDNTEDCRQALRESIVDTVTWFDHSLMLLLPHPCQRSS